MSTTFLSSLVVSLNEQEEFASLLEREEFCLSRNEESSDAGNGPRKSL